MMTLVDILDELLCWRRGRGDSVRTLRSVRYELCSFLFWLKLTWHVETPDRLRKRHLHQFQSHLVGHHTAKGMPLKTGTINNRIKAVRSLLGFLKTQGYVSVDLSSELPYLKEPKLLPTSVLEHGQIRKLIRSVATTSQTGWRDRVILELLYSTGVRANELITMTLDVIDLENGLIKVHGKGDKERMVPVGKTALRCLESYIKAIRPFWRGSHQTRVLFLNTVGGPLNWQNLQRIIRCRCSGMDVRVTAHTFRRSCTTELIRNDANLYHVKDLLGHESIDTLKPYIKLTISDLKKTHAKCHPREKDDPL